MSARGDVLSLPRSGARLSRRMAWGILWAMVVAAIAVAASVYISNRSAAPAPAKPLTDQGVNAVTGTGPGLEAIAREWSGQPVPAITGTGPDLAAVGRMAGAAEPSAPAITGTGPDLAFIAGGGA